MVESLERQNSELKERISQQENNRNSAFERQIESFEQQRQELNAKIDKLMYETLEKDK